MKGLTIGKVAKGAGIGIETVRFYEKEGLLEPPERTTSNYRIYSNQVITRLHFIKRAKTLGFTLKEIKELLSLRHNHSASKSAVKVQVEAKIDVIRLKIRDLENMLSTLETLDECCDGKGSADDCPILNALDGGAELNCEGMA